MVTSLTCRCDHQCMLGLVLGAMAMGHGIHHGGSAGQLSGALLLLYKSLRSTSLQRDELAAQTSRSCTT